MGLPVEINPLFVSSTAGYTVGRSLRFRSSASAYLNRTPASNGNRQIYTWNSWVKRGTLGAAQRLFVASDNNLIDDTLGFLSGDTLTFYLYNNGYQAQLVTTQVFRDPSAWYMITVAVDTTQATASNRIKLYINGVQVTAFSTATYPTQNLSSSGFNTTNPHNIGRYVSGVNYLDGYLAEVNFIDGQALTPSSFGAYDTNGVWQPLKYTGTYGTNGFYLPFSNTTSTTTLVQDSSGNGNNWTPNNISLTAGTTYDSMIDSPTVSASSSNYAVINPLKRNICTISNANMTAAGPQTYTKSVVCSISMPSGSGKYYWECVFTRTSTTDGAVFIGIVSPTWNAGEAAGSPSVYPGNTSDSWGVEGNGGQKVTNASFSAYGSAFASGDIIMVAYDAVNGSLFAGKNGTWFNSGVPSSNTGYAFTGITTEVLPAFGIAYDVGSSIVNANFGQRPFSYTPPTGYSALNTYNLPTPTIKNGALYNAATLWSGDNTNPRSISNSQSNGGNNAIGKTFKSDFVWIKQRTANGGGFTDHQLYDSVRGIQNLLRSNTTNAELSNPANGGVQSFDSSGFTTQGSSSNVNTNNTGETYVGWQWNAGSGSSSSNTSGSITSTVSVNTTAGFSVVTWTGTFAAATVGHGLGVAPSMIIVKTRTQAAVDWAVYHTSIGATNGLYLNATNAQFATSTWWNNTSPTSSVFSVAGAAQTNGNAQNMVAYCFAAVRGYSAFGSYTGNGSTDGPFIYLGFRPRFILTKRTDAAGANWTIYDSSRDTYNVAQLELYPNTSGAEATSANARDFLSNGYKLRTTDSWQNASGGTYIYAAFCENPFNYSRAR